MPEFKYGPTILKGSAFRLIRLLKGTNEVIQCQLFESQLDSKEHHGSYAAVSYTWGAQSRPCQITINGSEMAVTKNAYLALRDLRYQDKDRILWLDAVCINQDNDKERGHQVQHMGSIYGKAERVLIWLGEADYETALVMQYMQKLQIEGIGYASDDQKISSTWSAIAQSLSEDRRNLLVTGLKLLLSRSWFRRVWIIQETANASNAEIFCGNHGVLARIFVLMPSLLKVTLDPHCQSIFDIMPGPYRNNSWWAKKRDLHTLLIKFCSSEATEDRDHIYALLSIASNTYNTDILKADYEKDIKDVIFETCLFLLDLNKLDPPVCRFLDWNISEFLGNLKPLDTEILKYAAMRGCEAVVALLLQNGTHVDFKDWKRTPLSYAAAGGHQVVVTLLLEAKANIESKDYQNRTPLSYAAAGGHKAVVALLLEANANIESKDYQNRTPLSYAAAGGHKAVVALLLEANATIDSKEKDGQTPLSYAAAGGHEVVVTLLLEAKANIKSIDRMLRTPLTHAAAGGHKAVVILLLEAKADIEARDKHYRTPLSYAARGGHEAVVILLLETNADIEARDKYHWTPLSHAARRGYKAVVTLLLAANADVESKDHKNRTPLSYAAELGYMAIVTYVLLIFHIMKCSFGWSYDLSFKCIRIV